MGGLMGDKEIEKALLRNETGKEISSDSGVPQLYYHGACASGGSEGSAWHLPLSGREGDMVERENVKLSTAALLVLGQVLSLMITIAGVASAVLSRQGINAPTAVSFLNYFLLFVVFSPSLFKSISPTQVVVPWYVYFIMALTDVEGNYLNVKSYQYTPITSVMLLDSWTIPCVLFLTWLFLNARYLPAHFWGVAICMAGLSIGLFSDVHAKDGGGGKAPVLGDLMVVTAATLFAFSNVIEEYLARKVDQSLLICNMGLYGMIISFCQLMVLERKELSTIHWNSQALIAFFAYGIALFLFYVLVPIMLERSGSALFNLSLLTSDMMAVAVRSLKFHQHVDWLYFVALTTVAGGLYTYSCSGEPMVEHEGNHEDIESSAEPNA